MGQKKGRDLDDSDLEFDDEPEEEEDVPMVERPLKDKDVRARIEQLADEQIALLDLEEERTKVLKELNADIKERKSSVRKLATEIKTRMEKIPAQLELEEANKSRTSRKRAVQPAGAENGVS